MNAYTIFAFTITLSAASAGVIGPSTVVLQGPSRKTTVIGPEGSVIAAVAPGGQIVTEEHPGVVAHAAHVPQIIAAVIVDPEVPAAPLVAQQFPPLVHTVPVAQVAGEGQYIHDHGEGLYDDGSYKPHLY